MFITLGMAPLQMLGDEVVLTAQARDLDGEPVLRVAVITERIPPR